MEGKDIEVGRYYWIEFNAKAALAKVLARGQRTNACLVYFELPRRLHIHGEVRDPQFIGECRPEDLPRFLRPKTTWGSWLRTLWAWMGNREPDDGKTPCTHSELGPCRWP